MTWKTGKQSAKRSTGIGMSLWTNGASKFPSAIARICRMPFRSVTPIEFVGFYGLENFRRDWPALRAALPSDAAKRAGVYDLAWSRAVGGGWNLKPTPDFFKIPAQQRAFLVQVAQHPGKSIYEVAKALGMQYRRARDHAVNLVHDGKIRAVETVEGGRRKKQLYPAYAAGGHHRDSQHDGSGVK